jgi:hypothetical protein
MEYACRIPACAGMTLRHCGSNPPVIPTKLVPDLSGARESTRVIPAKLVPAVSGKQRSTLVIPADAGIQ